MGRDALLRLPTPFRPRVPHHGCAARASASTPNLPASRTEKRGFNGRCGTPSHGPLDAPRRPRCFPAPGSGFGIAQQRAVAGNNAERERLRAASRQRRAGGQKTKKKGPGPSRQMLRRAEDEPCTLACPKTGRSAWSIKNAPWKCPFPSPAGVRHAAPRPAPAHLRGRIAPPKGKLLEQRKHFHAAHGGRGRTATG